MLQIRFIGRLYSVLLILKDSSVTGRVVDYFLFLANSYNYNLGYWYIYHKLIKFTDGKHFRYVIQEVFLNKVYSFFSEKNKPVIIDIGANIGVTSLYFKDLFPKSKIFAFEPNPIAYTLLVRNKEINKVSGLYTFNIAVTSQEKSATIDFYISNESVVSTAIKDYRDERFLFKKIKVKSISFKKIIASFKFIDLLKVDVEGSEYGYINTLVQNADKIDAFIIEFHVKDLNQFKKNIKKLLKKYLLWNTLYVEDRTEITEESLNSIVKDRNVTVCGKLRTSTINSSFF